MPHPPTPIATPPPPAGERLCDELAPELTSLLSTVQMPANFVPVTNTVLREMHRRGVSRDRLVGCLREMGREVPPPVVRMLQWAARRGLPVTVLSDCNSVFISHILTGGEPSWVCRLGRVESGGWGTSQGVMMM